MRTQMGFQIDTMKSLAISDSISDWLRAPSRWYQFENPSQKTDQIVLSEMRLQSLA